MVIPAAAMACCAAWRRGSRAAESMAGSQASSSTLINVLKVGRAEGSCALQHAISFISHDGQCEGRMGRYPLAISIAACRVE